MQIYKMDGRPKYSASEMEGRPSICIITHILVEQIVAHIKRIFQMVIQA